MKTIFKILVIVVVAVLVGGLFYSVVAASSGTDQALASERSFPADGELSRPDKAEGGGELQFPADLIKNLVIISVVSITYLNVTRWMGGKKKTTVKISDV